MSWKKELVIKNLAWINKLIFKLYFMALSFTTRCQLSTLVCILIMNVLISIGLRVTRSSSICWPPWSSSTTHLSTTGSLATLSTCLHPDASLLSRPLQVQAETLNRYSMMLVLYDPMKLCWNNDQTLKFCKMQVGWVLGGLQFGICAPACQKDFDLSLWTKCFLPKDDSVLWFSSQWKQLKVERQFLHWISLPSLFCRLLGKHNKGFVILLWRSQPRKNKNKDGLQTHLSALLNSAFSCSTTSTWLPIVTNPSPYCVSSRASPTPKWSSSRRRRWTINSTQPSCQNVMFFRLNDSDKETCL